MKLLKEVFMKMSNKNLIKIFTELIKYLRKIIRKKLALISWKGYPKKFNSWISLNDVKKI